MPRSFLVWTALVVVVLGGALFALSRVDSSRQPKHVEKPVPENALAK